MVKCCASYGCPNRDENPGETGIGFHQFPKDRLMRQKWIQALRRLHYDPSSSAVICSEHFEKEDYRENTKRRVLKKDAVPSVFKGFPAHLQKEVKKRRILPERHPPSPTPTPPPPPPSPSPSPSPCTPSPCSSSSPG